jgi:hypothetical protein
LTPQGFDQRGALVAQRRAVLPLVVLEIDKHVGSSGRGHGRNHSYPDNIDDLDELQNTLGPILGVGVLVILVMMVFKPGD